MFLSYAVSLKDVIVVLSSVQVVVDVLLDLIDVTIQMGVSNGILTQGE
jgi:hypothetical protein